MAASMTLGTSVVLQDVSGDYGNAPAAKRPAAASAAAAPEALPPSALVTEFLPSEDLLEQADFNVVEYVNRLFPSEQALAGLDIVMDRLNRKIRTLNDDVVDAVRSQALAGDQGKRDLDQAKLSIEELFAKIAEIKRKAEQSEVMVQEICKDIKELDHAKKNLTDTIKILSHLKLLVTGVGKLEDMANTRHYREVADLLQVTAALAGFFAEHHNAQLETIRSIVNNVKSKLQKEIFDAFEALRERDNMANVDFEYYQDCCVVAEALGPEVQHEIKQWFVEIQLHQYKTEFNPNKPEGGLEHVDKRYSWLKKKLGEFEDTYGKVFPASWNLEHEVCMEFCKKTKKDFEKIIEAARDQLNVGAFLHVMQTTLDLEAGLAGRFKREEAVPDTDLGIPAGDDELAAKTMSAGDQVRAKYEAHKRAKEREEAALRGPVMQMVDAVEFIGVISSCFEPYMNLYIAEEDKNLQALIDLMDKTEKWLVWKDHPDGILQGSKDLVMYFRKSLGRCSNLSKGQAFYDLYKTFKKYITSYMNELSKRIPKAREVQRDNLSLIDLNIKLTDEEALLMCAITNTLVYLQSAVEALEGVMKRKIDAVYRDDLTFEHVPSEFQKVISTAILVLVIGLESRMDPHLQTMAKGQWDKVESLGPRSEYVEECLLVLQAGVPPIKQALADTYFRRFCDKFASTFPQRVISNGLLKIKRVNDLGWEQLFADVQALKAALMDLPNMGTSSTAAAPRGYIGILRKEMSRAEGMCKCGMLPIDDMFASSFMGLVMNGTREEAVRLLEMRSIKRSDINSLLESFVAPAAANPEDSPASGGAGTPATGRRDLVDTAKTRLQGTVRKLLNKGGDKGGTDG